MVHPFTDNMASFARKAKSKAKGMFLSVFQPQAIINTVVLTLQLFEKTAAHVPVPGLKVAVGSLLAVVEQLQVRTTTRTQYSAFRL